MVVGLALAGLCGCGQAADGEAVSVEAVRSVDTAATGLASCAVISAAAVQAALGDDAAHIAGPELVGPATCSWHSGDPTCTMRSLGVQLVAGADAAAGFAAARLDEVLRADADGFGDDAFFSTAVLPAGSGTEIERLDVREGDSWYRFTVAGRLGDNGREILTIVARSVFA